MQSEIEQKAEQPDLPKDEKTSHEQSDGVIKEVEDIMADLDEEVTAAR